MFRLQLFHALGHFMHEFVVLGLMAGALGAVRKDVVQGGARIVTEVGVEGHGLVPLAAAPVPVAVPGEIRADLVDPGRKSGGSAEGGQHPVGPDEGILGDFLGILTVTEQGEDLGEDATLIFQDQLVVSRQIPLTGAVQGGLVGFGLHGGSLKLRENRSESTHNRGDISLQLPLANQPL